MALVYYFESATPMTVEEVASGVADVAIEYGISSGPIDAQVVLEPGIVTRFGTWIRVAVSKPSAWGDPVEEDFGFTPTVRVMFRYDKFTDTVEQGDDMVRIVSGLVDRIPGNSVLHMSEAVDVWLLCRDGDLDLSADDIVWSRRRLAMISRPYQRATHSFT